MKQEFKITAKTVEEAYAKANDIYGQLGDLEIEVISSGKKGFLGIGSKPAEIKVIIDDGIQEKKPEPKIEKKIEPKIEPKIEAKKPQQKPQQKNEPKPQPKKEEAKAQAPAQEKKQEKKQEPKPEVKAEIKAEKPEEKVIPTKEQKEENINVTVEEKTLAMNFLKDFVRDIGLSCEVKGDLTLNEKGFVSRVITIEGEEAPSLIGHRGDMLDALQYLANLCLARKSEGDHKEYVKVIVDIAGYREKREQTLRALARRMAEKAIKYQRNVPLEPMNPYERMIIHSEIQGIEGVSTHSVGYDENRKIVICPDKKRNKK
ncbi:MAG: Jag N-terminal domain-containing protein [Clostridia bacterium]|nr:Jag N-terminal domain-containing protein [Clostridia bacterium]